MEINAETFLIYGNIHNDTIMKLIYNCASEGLHTWCIIPERINEISKHVIVPHIEALKLITFLYIQDYKQLIQCLNTAHLFHNCPRVIVIANLNRYTSFNDTNVNMNKLNCFTIASVLDSIQSCSNKHKKKCILMFTSGYECNNNIIQTIAQTYVKHIIHVEEDNDNLLTEVNNILNVYY